MKRPLIILFSLFFLALPSFCIDFTLFTSLDNYFTDKWDKTQFEAYPALSTCSKVVRNQYFWTYLFFKDYDIGENNRPNVVYTMKIKDEAGNIVYDLPDLPGLDQWADKTKPEMLSVGNIKTSFEDKHPLGKYQIIVEVNDILSGQTKIKTDTILLVDKIEGDQFNSEEQVNDWMMRYYLAPSPQNLLNAVKYEGSLSKQLDKDKAMIIVNSYDQILSDNKYLMPQLISEYRQNTNENTKQFILNILAHSEVGVDSFEATLSDKENISFKQDKETVFLDPYADPTNPTQFDMLWGIFMVTGGYKPVLKLAQDLELVRYKGGLEEYKNQPTWASKIRAENEAYFNSLVWSLTSNAKQYSLVRDYLIYIYVHETLDPDVKTELKSILIDAGVSEEQLEKLRFKSLNE